MKLEKNKTWVLFIVEKKMNLMLKMRGKEGKWNYQKREVQTRTAQLLVCIVVEEEDAEDEPYATELQQRWVAAKINKRNALNLKKLPIFNPQKTVLPHCLPGIDTKPRKACPLSRLGRGIGIWAWFGSGQIISYFSTRVWFSWSAKFQWAKKWAKSQCPSPMVVDIDFGMSHT